MKMEFETNARIGAAFGAGAGIVAFAALAPLDAPRSWIALVVIGLAAAGRLAGIDLCTGRIPNVHVLPVVLVTVVAVVVGCGLSADWDPLTGALIGATVVGLPWLVAAVLSGNRAVGGGDVKLAVQLGLLLGVVDMVAVEAALAMSLLAWLLLGFITRRRRGERFVFGPALVAAALTSLVLVSLVSGRGVLVAIERLR